VKFEVVPFDNRLSAQEALSQLNSIIGQNIRYVVQGASSSAVGLALQEAIESTTAATPARKSST
jgi:branched-chain amino acid transport system substrate-binding protein